MREYIKIVNIPCPPLFSLFSAILSPLLLFFSFSFFPILSSSFLFSHILFLYLLSSLLATPFLLPALLPFLPFSSLLLKMQIKCPSPMSSSIFSMHLNKILSFLRLLVGGGGLRPALFVAYFWLCAQECLLVGLGKPDEDQGAKLELASFKASTYNSTLYCL